MLLAVGSLSQACTTLTGTVFRRTEHHQAQSLLSEGRNTQKRTCHRSQPCSTSKYYCYVALNPMIYAFIRGDYISASICSYRLLFVKRQELVSSWQNLPVSCIFAWVDSIYFFLKEGLKWNDFSTFLREFEVVTYTGRAELVCEDRRIKFKTKCGRKQKHDLRSLWKKKDLDLMCLQDILFLPPRS